MGTDPWEGPWDPSPLKILKVPSNAVSGNIRG
jgi:hypothetical protein